MRRGASGADGGNGAASYYREIEKAIEAREGEARHRKRRVRGSCVRERGVSQPPFWSSASSLARVPIKILIAWITD